MTVFRKLEDQKFPEGAVISLECELSRHNLDVKWMKASVVLLGKCMINKTKKLILPSGMMVY